MKKQTPVTCPYLGFRNERDFHYLEPSDAHCCYSPKNRGELDLEHQQAFCFSSAYHQCERFAQPPEVRALVPVSAIRAPALVTAPAQPARLPVRYDAHRALACGFVHRRLELMLWALAAIMALVTVYVALPFLVALASPWTVATTPIAEFAARPTKTPTPTDTTTITTAELSTPIPSQGPKPSPLIIPTPPPNGFVTTLSPDPSSTGWVASDEPIVHWGDRYLRAGSLDNKEYASILQFNLPNIPAKSKILFAALELTGRDSSQLGKTGQWQLELLNAAANPDWSNNAGAVIQTLIPLGMVGHPLAVSDLAPSNVNRFEFNAAQRELIADQLAVGHVNFLLRATNINGNSLFNWDAGGGGGSDLDAPTLYLVVVPGPYFVVTNTRVPTNVLTAAAQVVQATARAKKFGTPTPLPRGIATATGQVDTIYVPPPATPANNATRYAERVLATAIAITTGTFTPTPTNIVIAYPTQTPVVIDIDQLVPPATLTPAGNLNYFATPIPRSLVNKILVQSNRLGANYKNLPIVMDSTGAVSEVLSSRALYDAAAARESFSPDRKRRAIVAPDAKGVLQIWILELDSNNKTPITNVSRGIAYDPVWSPDGRYIAYVATQTGITEIYVYDLETRTSKQLTLTSGPDFFNQRPSWSPDSQKLVFKSNRDDVTRFQIYLMNADGSNLKNISANQYDEFDPIWVKP